MSILKANRIENLTTTDGGININNSGNVGIGTASPHGNSGTNLHIHGSNTTAELRLTNTTTGTGANGSIIQQGGNTLYISNSEAGSTAFENNGSERVRITSSGQLLVGASSGGANLVIGDVNTPSFNRGAVAIKAVNDGNSIPANIYLEEASGAEGYTLSIDSDGDLNFHNSGAATPTVTFSDLDRVGIGTATPGDQLHIHTASSGAANVRFSSTDVPNGFFVGFDGQEIGQIWHTANKDIRIATNNTERMRIDSSGRVGIGTTATQQTLTIDVNDSNTTQASFNGINIANTNTTANNGSAITFGQTVAGNSNARIGVIQTARGPSESQEMFFGLLGSGSYSERMRIDSSGKVGIGTSSPSAKLDCRVTTNNPTTGSPAAGSFLQIRGDDATVGNGPSLSLMNLSGSKETGFRISAVQNSTNNGDLAFHGYAGGATYDELMRITSSGKVGIGTAAPKRDLHLDGGSGSVNIQLTNDTTGKTSDGDGFQLQLATDGTARVIQRENLALAFDTNNTERMRVTSGGTLIIGATDSALATIGSSFTASGSADHTRSGANVVYINRLTNDGNLIQFYGDTNFEGSISISGSTISYNGGHLTRWSQLASGAARTEILRGSVLSNLDEMCEWGEEDNEQLNRMKVSDVEGDVNVAGVFQAWDDDDDTYVNDFYCAMTGDFIIRIAQGTTVARGDLLMSAGNGTAKPQDDDIVRSKTIAKVTSTTVSTTYSDGSYCVPCVLMAC